ncbi:MAG: helix-turn-helix transcriptional regulator [Chromatiales bacterium]|nr:helix-turn-helix transcriptional regulator [Chromatiales bacterium]
MASSKIIKKSIRIALAKNGQKQKWLADKIGTSEVQLSKWANKDHLNTATIEMIAMPFNMSVSEFIALGEQ